ncbi:MAG: hypothetical protein K0Q79_1409 [Flavipsychrobacter sp.]|nr:hypothetical protein [Flavipsychrobacter sp.]
MTFGDDKRNTSSLFSRVKAFYNLYIGTDFSFSKGLIKNISAGIEYSALFTRSVSDDFIVYTYPTLASTTHNTDKYFENYRSFGLKLAVGFWR